MIKIIPHGRTRHQVIIRGIKRKAIFKDDADRNEFIQRMASIFADSATPCFAWTLMTNHVHPLGGEGMGNQEKLRIDDNDDLTYRMPLFFKLTIGSIFCILYAYPPCQLAKSKYLKIRALMPCIFLLRVKIG